MIFRSNVLLLVLFGLLVVACSDTSVSEDVDTQNVMGMQLVENEDALPTCEDEIIGEIFLVQNLGEAFYCNGKEWKAMGVANQDSVDKQNSAITCETKPLPQNEGVAIYCGGDSIGVILNGTNGINGTNGANGTNGLSGDGCHVSSQTAEVVAVTCGKETFTIPLPQELDQNDGSVVKNLKLTGYTQKGPFVNGSDVMAFELANGQSLGQTGKSYKGAITTSDGYFDVNVVSLTSQYVQLIGSGYYLNEVSGEKSSGQLSLNALTDLTERDRANINLLTHLEFFRVQELVKNKKLGIGEAKLQAEREILEAFHMELDNFGNTEDLNIFSKGEDNAVLLAISILLQRDNDVASLTGELATLSKDLADDGEWNGKTALAMRTKIADWAEEVNLSVIRDNIEKWDLGADVKIDVPDFERFVRKFWNDEYGLGVCDESVAGVVKIDTAVGSKYYASSYGDNEMVTRFICSNKMIDGSLHENGKYLWRKTNDLEANTYQWSCENGVITDEKGIKHAVGEFVTGRIGNEYKCFEDGIKLVRGYVRYEGWNYKIVRINDLVWFAENLKVHYNHGSAFGTCYDESNGGCEKYGRYYTWSAVIDSAEVYTKKGKICGNKMFCNYYPGENEPIRGICPEGWHIPTSNDFTMNLGFYLGHDYGKFMDETWYNSYYGIQGTNSTGFSAIPTGYGKYVEGRDIERYSNGDVRFGPEFRDDPISAYWWCFWEVSYDKSMAYYVKLGLFSNDDGSMNLSSSYGYNYKSYAMPVRCVRDDP